MRVNKLKSNQNGMVAIAVTIIILSITSLIVIGFATISRREQRQSLDKQLSSEAYYAAESGVNYLADKLQANEIDGDKTTCTEGLSTIPKTLKDNVEYTCALVYQSVDSLEYTLKEGESRVIALNAADNIGAIEVSWQNADSSKLTFAINPDHYLPQLDFTKATSNSYTNNTGILRATVIPIYNNMTRASLMNDSQTVFMYPQTHSTAGPDDFGTINAGSGAANQGLFLDANCNTNVTITYYCRAKINNVNNLTTSTTNKVFLRLKSIYQDSVVRVRVYQLGNENLIPVSGAQAVVDVTARAQDVVKRIQARIPVGRQYWFPEFGVQTAGSICKRLYSWPASSYGPAGYGFNVPDRNNPRAPLDIDRDIEAQTCNPDTLLNE